MHCLNVGQTKMLTHSRHSSVFGAIVCVQNKGGYIDLTAQFFEKGFETPQSMHTLTHCMVAITSSQAYAPFPVNAKNNSTRDMFSHQHKGIFEMLPDIFTLPVALAAQQRCDKLTEEQRPPQRESIVLSVQPLVAVQSLTQMSAHDLNLPCTVSGDMWHVT